LKIRKFHCLQHAEELRSNPLTLDASALEGLIGGD